ncbi:hypothetical protein [Streptomyces jumonjinensis]|uniref:hypothetical protein n=1 Tax=Streptomyces jumonjinensis TaxID=1945 RepID=UPI0037947710
MRSVKVLGVTSLLGLAVLGGARVVQAEPQEVERGRSEHRHQALTPVSWDTPVSQDTCAGYVGICGQSNVYAPNVSLLNLLTILAPTPTPTPPAPPSDRNIKSDIVSVVWER